MAGALGPSMADVQPTAEGVPSTGLEPATTLLRLAVGPPAVAVTGTLQYAIQEHASLKVRLEIKMLKVITIYRCGLPCQCDIKLRNEICISQD